jgi:pyruvate kinase
MSDRIKRLTKVIATLGPASQVRLEEMIEAGVNVFRLNFSHKGAKQDYENLVALIKNIRAAADKLNQPIAIMGDLQGPKFRIGELKDHKPVTLVPGARLKFSVGTELGHETHLFTKNAPVVQGLRIGHKVLLDDGSLELRVVERLDIDNILCEVVVGGKLGEKKGINVPDIVVSSKLSDKDKEDAKFSVEQNLDYICLSFVQSADDVIELREFMKDHAPPPSPNISKIQKHASWAQKMPLIICKIEKPQAVGCIQKIIEATDGIMVARGDLGVEMSLERVPAIQKMLIELCNAAAKPVITATQMLQSMIDNPVPTRAEVSDVANAVFDGSDCVMLSAESAVGSYPVQSVATMVRIIQEAEKDLSRSIHRRRNTLFIEMQETLQLYNLNIATADNIPAPIIPQHETIAQCAVSAARKAGCSAIIVISYSGLMATRISKHKPDVPIIALTPDPVAYRRMALIGYLYPLLFKFQVNADDTLVEIEKIIAQKGYLPNGDTVVLCAGTTHLPSLSNTIKLYSFGAISGNTK